MSETDVLVGGKRGRGVGRSESRTPFKHFLLNGLLGREAGIYSVCPRSVHARAVPWHIIDMNAGDGVAPCDGETSSPQVIIKHACFASFRKVSVRVTLIEKARVTFDNLVENTGGNYSFQFDRICGDAREYRVPRTSKHQAVFVHTDPNHVSDWCVSRELLESFSETTTLLATLGCNVGGLKRLPAEQRSIWFDHVRSVTNSMPRYHDATLVHINRVLVDHKMQRDPQHWAYLIRNPSAWTHRIIEDAFSGAKKTGVEIEAASVRLSNLDFSRITRKLFLTASERSDSNG